MFTETRWRQWRFFLFLATQHGNEYVDIETLKSIIALLGGLVGASGLAAYVRAQGQNRNEAAAALTTEQIEFRKAMAEELAVLRADIKRLNESNATLVLQAADARAENRLQEREIGHKNETLTSLMLQFGELQRDHEELKSNYDRALMQIDQLSKKAMDQERKIMILEQQLDRFSPKSNEPALESLFESIERTEKPE